MKLNENLLALRQRDKLSQEEVAESLNLSRQAVAKWESGQAYPDIDNLILLSDLYGVTLDSMVRNDNICNKLLIENYDNTKESFVGFLCKAKIKTYAGKAVEEKTPSRPNAHDLIYREDNLIYIDTYLGGERFVGEEAIWRDDIPQWSMNYSGRVLKDSFQSDFLKDALSRVNKEMPYRGPSLYQKGSYTYHCSVRGVFEWFSGQEEIYYNDVKVYECLFHGGIIK